VIGELKAFRRRRLSPEQGKEAASRVLETPIKERLEKAAELFLDDPETLLPLLDALRVRGETSPAEVLDEATSLYRYLESLEPRYPVDAFLLDEHDYFLGETARIAGAASRILARREEARRWLDLAEGWFLLTENASGNLSKVMYQRLAVRMEERDFEGVAALLPQLISSFEKLGMGEDRLKARFLHAAMLRERDDIQSAIDVYRGIVDEARELKNEPLLAHAYTNLVQLHGFRGDASEAFKTAKEAMPLLRRLGNHVAIAKLQWGLGYLQQVQGNALASIESFRIAQTEFAEIGMRADVAAVHLVIADLLLDAGQEKQAEWEIRQALPIIDEYKLVPEGFAALSLLRESLRRQKIDRQALRHLHGYFEEQSA
jgi:tetratricopeptide (TPR) repeat protein